MKKEKITPEEKKELKQANTALNQLISMAKKKGAFISEEVIKQPPAQTKLFDN